MNKAEKVEWLENTINDLFMDFLFYNRKGCVNFHVDKMRKEMDSGVFSKEKMIELFTNQINKEYKT